LSLISKKKSDGSPPSYLPLLPGFFFSGIKYCNARPFSTTEDHNTPSGLIPIFPDHSKQQLVQFSQRLLQSDCIARILNDDLADEKNKVYSEQNA